ncbi:MAG: 4-hydroxy-tetrahydrodipicolinate reductase [Parvularculaceae bacterium]
MTEISILVAGAGGRMGRAVITEVLAARGATLAGGFERPGSDAVGADLGHLVGLDRLGLAVADAPDEGLKHASVLIDFTTPSASLDHARACAAAGRAHVIGATGFSPAEEKEIAALAEKIAIVKSGNMSLGVNLLSALVEQAAAKLSDAYDIEILDIHHRMKIDTPSGTALMLGKAAAKGRCVDLDRHSVYERYGQTGARKKGDIGFAVLRGGGVIGEHEVRFAGDQEVLTLSHSALDRRLFAKGAVAAAKWTIGQPSGLYSMRDVLGL